MKITEKLLQGLGFIKQDYADDVHYENRCVYFGYHVELELIDDKWKQTNDFRHGRFMTLNMLDLCSVIYAVQQTGQRIGKEDKLRQLKFALELN